MHQLPDPFGPINVLQLVYAQVPKGQFGGEGFANQIRSYARDKHLPAVGSRAQAVGGDLPIADWPHQCGWPCAT